MCSAWGLDCDSGTAGIARENVDKNNRKIIILIIQSLMKIFAICQGLGGVYGLCRKDPRYTKTF